MMAQSNVPPCPPPSLSFYDAPLIDDCCLNGYTFGTLSFGGLDLPPGFCGTVENGQWLAYQAPRRLTGMLLGIEVTNCFNPPNFQGVQLQVYEAAFASCDLYSLTPVGNCIETTTSDSTQINMVPGHVYYIFIDGFQGDICEYKLRVLGRIQCPAPQPSLNGPTTVSAGQAATYTITFPPDNCFYEYNNPCGNVRQDTVTCLGICLDNTTSFTYTWTGPPGSSVVMAPDGLSAIITMGSTSGYVRVEINGPCYHKVLELFVNVCDDTYTNESISICEGSCVTPYFDTYCSQGVFTEFELNPDGCYTIHTINIIVLPTPPSPILSGPSHVCDNSPITLQVSNAAPATNYIWNVPSGTSFTGGNSATIVTNNTNPGQYCVMAQNNCGTSQPICKTISNAMPLTNLAAISICQAELPYDFNGTSVTASGSYSATLQSWQGCDSIVQQNITVLPEIPPTYLPEVIFTCSSNGPIDFHGQSISSGGHYEAILQSSQGCDSLVILVVLEYYPLVDVSINSSAGTVLPIGGSTVLEAVVDPNTPFSGVYEWSNGEYGQTITVDQPGTYVLILSNGSCAYYADITITQANAACPNFNLPIAPADSCATAPSFCGAYLAGFCSANDGYTPDLPGNLGSILPCTIENNQWLKFTACDTAAWFELAVNNCQSGLGLQFAVLQTADCQSFTANSSCFNIANGNTDTLFASNLVAGQTYYLMIDGVTADICDWQVISTFGVSEGAVYQAENTPGDVIPVDPTTTESCGGDLVPFTFTPAICDELTLVSGCLAEQQFCTPFLDTCITIVRYDTVWHVTPYGWGATFENNDSIGGVVNIIFPSAPPPSQAGADSLIFTISVEFVAVELDTVLCWNDCISECATILPATQPCEIRPRRHKVCFPDNLSESRIICPGECVFFHGQQYCAPGTYTVTEPGNCGCLNSYTLILDWYWEPFPVIGPPSYVCSPDGSTYTVSFYVEAFGTFVTVSGQPLTGNTFTSGPIPSGQPYNFSVENFGTCLGNVQVVSGTYACQPCIGNTYDLGATALCPSECFELLGNNYCSPGSYNELLLNPATNCLETYIFELTQTTEQQLAVGTVSRFCDATNLYYQVGFSIESGTPPYKVNGNAISGNFYQSGLIPTGQPYAFTVTDAAVCAPQQVDVAGTYTCNCINNPGSTQYATLYACDDNMASVQFNNDAVVGPDDLFVFILHADNGASLGQIIGMNTTGTFGFVPGSMTYGQTYRISPAVGPDLGGTVDMGSACFQFAPGQPVVFYEKPEVEILPHDKLNCLNNPLMLNSLTLLGSGDYSHAWSGPTNFSSTGQNANVTLPGAYTLLVTDNLTGCSSTTATAVEEDYTTPVFTLTQGEINCQQSFATLEAASQMPGLSYTWTFPTNDQMAGATITTNVPGTYTVVATGMNGCTSNGTTLVEDNGTPPSLEVEDATINCAQPTATLSATSNDPTATFTWTQPDGTQVTGPNLSTSLPGVYSVSVLTQSGCTEEGEAIVTQVPDPVLTALLMLVPPTCFGDQDGSIVIMPVNSGPVQPIYSIDGLGQGTSFQGLPAGEYHLHIEEVNGCQGDTLIQLIEPHEMTVDLGADRFTRPGVPVELAMQASPDPTHILWVGPNGENWQDLTSLTVAPMATCTYQVVISDENGCQASDEVTVFVEGNTDAYLPTAFSPNGDGKNDRFTVFAGGNVKQVAHLQIFDRWGEMVFEAHDFAPNDDLHLGWDGRHRGRAMDPAPFIVMAEVEFVDGTKKALTGEVVLVK